MAQTVLVRIIDLKCHTCRGASLTKPSAIYYILISIEKWRLHINPQILEIFVLIREKRKTKNYSPPL
jgi:hypothetical protein